MNTNIFGYIRVSSKDQNIDRQIIAFSPFEIPTQNLFIEKSSGRTFERAVYKKLVKSLKKGNLLIIKSIDRLGRNYHEIKDQWRFLAREKEVDIKVIDMPLLDTTFCKNLLSTFISDLVLEILSFCAQLEWEHNKQRQAEGIAAAKQRGVRFGRESLPLPNDFDEIYKKWRSGEYSTERAAALCGFSRRTLYEKTEKMRSQHGL